MTVRRGGVRRPGVSRKFSPTNFPCRARCGSAAASTLRPAAASWRAPRSVREFAQCVVRDPAGGGRVNQPDAPGLGNGGAPQARVALADLPQRPVDGFLHEIALVGRLAPDDGKETHKNTVR